ncbi:MAG: hypothetical protein BAW33_02005 [Desulfobacterales bacterium C00003104]|nr:MAG: hypothetical protein BAW33_02005 [Desulfobacterales bacterium C00003104]
MICLFFCLLLLIVERHYGYAFYRESNDSNLSSFQFERIRGFSPGSPGVLAVSDNYSCMPKKQSQKPLVYRNSDRFVAMDLLEINLPINVALYRPGSLDNSLSDIFYADLKLKKLQDEYGKLQGRARELLAELGLSTRDLSFDAGGTRHPDQVLEQPSLSATAFDALGGTSDWDQALKPPPISASAFKPAGTQRPDQALRPTSISAARNELMRDHVSITKAPRLTPLVRVSSSKGLLRSALPPGAIKESSKGTEPDSDTKAEARRMTNHNGTIVFSEDSLIGKLFKIPSYILSHKLEALFLLVVLIVLLKLVSLGRT